MIKKEQNKPHDWRGKKITLMGLGLMGGGVADALFFIKHGAKLTITDLRKEKELKPSIEKINKHLATIAVPGTAIVEWVLGEHREKDFTDADLIIKNPAVPNNSPYLQMARENKVPVDMTSGIFFDIADTDKLIAITGTKGKSTTAALIHEILKLKYKDAYMAGLPGMPLMEKSEQAKKNWGVIELSSWQLEGADKHKKSAHIAVLTNIKEDHLNRHKTFKDYKSAKKVIYKYQNSGDYLVVSRELKNEVSDAMSEKIFFSGVDIKNTRTLLHPQNIGAALKVADILGIEEKKALKAIQSFKGLEGRLEYITTVDPAAAYNDTTATNPYATIESLKHFKDKKVALILGGEDKELDYSELAQMLKEVHFIALLPGSASDKIEEELMAGSLWLIVKQHLEKVKDLEEAIEKCIKSNPEVLLLSPAAASFNMFKNEFERGREFKKIIENLNT